MNRTPAICTGGRARSVVSLTSVMPSPRSPVTGAKRNACPAAEGREGDLDTARLLIRDPAAYAAALLPPLQAAAPAPVATGSR